MNNQSNSNNNAWMFGMGILAGAAVGYFLQTEKGKELRHEASQQANKISGELSETAQAKFGDLSNSFEKYVAEGRELINNLSSNVKETVDKATAKLADKAEDTEDSIERGVKKARKAINKQADKIENSLS